ncbi:MAG: SEC-C metal-binding domain-containing protein, partial [Elusimicrobiota bacterium]|nr:SEC-C metal-binding domain-containing protein [Elusimicrobiota bacterium]
RVESMNFDSRKQLLDYDNVMNKQRQAIYGLRNAILDGDDVTDRVKQMIEETLEDQFNIFTPKDKSYQLWNMSELNVYLKKNFGFSVDYNEDELAKTPYEAFAKEITDRALKIYENRFPDFLERNVDFAEMQQILLLQIIDHIWKNHLFELDHLKKGVGLRAYGQKDPLIEYQKESYAMFEKMITRVRDQMVEYVFKIQLPPRVVHRPKMQETRDGAAAVAAAEGSDGAQQKTAVIQKIGRNDPCPCGSGKKYKKCHGKNK